MSLFLHLDAQRFRWCSIRYQLVFRILVQPRSRKWQGCWSSPLCAILTCLLRFDVVVYVLAHIAHENPAAGFELVCFFGFPDVNSEEACRFRFAGAAEPDTPDLNRGRS